MARFPVMDLPADSCVFGAFGYVTNVAAVKMMFYPIHFKGIRRFSAGGASSRPMRLRSSEPSAGDGAPRLPAGYFRENRYSRDHCIAGDRT